VDVPVLPTAVGCGPMPYGDWTLGAIAVQAARAKRPEVARAPAVEHLPGKQGLRVPSAGIRGLCCSSRKAATQGGCPTDTDGILPPHNAVFGQSVRFG